MSKLFGMEGTEVATPDKCGGFELEWRRINPPGYYICGARRFRRRDMAGIILEPEGRCGITELEDA